jgi:hypothetical protein
MLLPKFSRPVSLDVKTHSRPKARFVLLSDSWRFVDVGRPLWLEDVSVVYNCCWSSSAQSFSGPGPGWLLIVFYCLRFETSFSSPSTTHRATAEVFDPACTSDTGLSFLLNNINKFISYLTGNTLRLRYKAEPVNAVWGKSRCLLWESYGTHKYEVWAECRVLVS